MSDIIERARALRAKIETLAIEHLDDTEAAANAELFPVWSGDSKEYKQGDKVRFNDILYKVLQAHTSQPDWAPDTAHSLFAKVLIPDEHTIPVWEKPGAENAYKTGDKVHFPDVESPVYQSLIDNNVWSPTEYPQGWKQL